MNGSAHEQMASSVVSSFRFHTHRTNDVKPSSIPAMSGVPCRHLSAGEAQSGINSVENTVLLKALWIYSWIIMTKIKTVNVDDG